MVAAEDYAMEQCHYPVFKYTSVCYGMSSGLMPLILS
jgi:hypothetical protein